MQVNNLKGATVSALFWKVFEKGGRAVVELAIQVVMARLLSPKEFGALAIMLVFVNVGNVIVTSGLNTALVQAEEIDETDLSTVFWLSFTVSASFIYVSYFFRSCNCNFLRPAKHRLASSCPWILIASHCFQLGASCNSST